ncbi:ADP-ribosylglycohydrolase family protein [Natronoglycomyces albus]|uniref:ADP-ribosylglycohydrolase family protein n=1 Tax=Natronoglycomyces albus TaxID=2811108 RepID=A0A895XMH4_9ACTN|nr:ADP-ribosylglycohydrolase family protein [Natronoglycomyces albus]QSB06327.1 ADP-ribosylglycohydrolase family protein [Natronoglycomyces albus]
MVTTSLPADRLRSTLLGGAIGDALGHPLENLNLAQIRAAHGTEGLTDISPLLITDDTQMTLFSFEGLMLADVDNEMSSVYNAYRRWLATQEQGQPSPGATGLAAQEWLYVRRGPGQACLTGLRQTDHAQVVNPDAKGCGTVMRAAPFGLFDHSPDDAFLLAAKCARFTHGHPTAAVSAGVLARLVSLLTRGHDLNDAVRECLRLLTYDVPSAGETRLAMREAVKAARQSTPSPEAVEMLGGGWVAEEALSIAVYCALVSDTAEEALLLAANHSGDSDSTAAICGNLLGAAGRKLPETWAATVEGRRTIDRLVAEATGSLN